MRIRDHKLPPGSRLADGLGRWVSIVAVTSLTPLVAMSFKPNHAWMHGRVALNDRTIMPLITTD